MSGSAGPRGGILRGVRRRVNSTHGGRKATAGHGWVHMIAIWMALIFAAVSLAAWLWLFPAAREVVAAGAGRWASRFGAHLARWHTGARARVDDSLRALHSRTTRVWAALARHRYLLAVALALLALPPWMVWQTRQQVALDGFGTTADTPPDARILELLRGEHLAPPTELPPAVFLAAEAELLRIPAASARPEAIARADRKWARIHIDLQQRVLAIYRVMREHGYEVVLVEGYRSPERQAELMRAGRGTNAGAGQSCHQYGLAVDSALYRDGRLQWDMRDPWTRRGYELYGELGTQAGLEWGGGWRSLKDYVHLELEDACRVARRAAGH